MKTIATINFKGGVGKTTVTWCLGDVISNFEDSSTLLFDLDAQMSLTQAVTLDADGDSTGKFAKWHKQAKKNDRTIYSILQKHLQSNLNDFQADNGFVYRLGKRYHFVPSTEQLYWLELETSDPEKGKFFIKNLLGKINHSPMLPSYNHMLFDCPPSFTMLSYSVLTCCDVILIPINPDFFAAQGVALLTAGLRHRIQPSPLPKLGVFANRVRTWGGKPTKAAQLWIDQVRDVCDNGSVNFLKTWVPDRASIRDAITNRQTPDELVKSFRDLWAEVREMLE